MLSADLLYEGGLVLLQLNTVEPHSPDVKDEENFLKSYIKKAKCWQLNINRKKMKNDRWNDSCEGIWFFNLVTTPEVEEEADEEEEEAGNKGHLPLHTQVDL